MLWYLQQRLCRRVSGLVVSTVQKQARHREESRMPTRTTGKGENISKAPPSANQFHLEDASQATMSFSDLLIPQGESIELAAMPRQDCLQQTVVSKLISTGREKSRSQP